MLSFADFASAGTYTTVPSCYAEWCDRKHSASDRDSVLVSFGEAAAAIREMLAAGN
jgi:hypothetical protein